MAFIRTSANSCTDEQRKVSVTLITPHKLEYCTSRGAITMASDLVPSLNPSRHAGQLQVSVPATTFDALSEPDREIILEDLRLAGHAMNLEIRFKR